MMQAQTGGLLFKGYFMAIGKPPIMKSPEQMQKLVDEYFEQNANWTITGLCLHCGFCSRQSFYDYEPKPEYSYIIKRARLMIEHGYEKALMSDKVTGPIFALKNMGWTDKQEIDHTTKGDKLGSPSDAVLAALKAKYDAN